MFPSATLLLTIASLYALLITLCAANPVPGNSGSTPISEESAGLATFSKVTYDKEDGRLACDFAFKVNGENMAPLELNCPGLNMICDSQFTVGTSNLERTGEAKRTDKIMWMAMTKGESGGAEKILFSMSYYPWALSNDEHKKTKSWNVQINLFFRPDHSTLSLTQYQVQYHNNKVNTDMKDYPAEDRGLVLSLLPAPDPVPDSDQPKGKVKSD
ncbi:hypothetical protein MMC09_004915 [Bachmanniomyces sp. S44760]|nr:hypothetical protein [Bachmanniomyces sp. S44760]